MNVWRVVLLVLLVHVGTTTCTAAEGFPCYRAFDLGGSGLKTALYDCSLSRLGRIQHLGYMQENDDPQTWVRHHLPTISMEISHGIRFGFAMASIYKLWDDYIDRSEGAPISEVLGLPAGSVFTAGDGTAHLMGMMEEVGQENTSFPVVNFAMGTGLGVAYTDGAGFFQEGPAMTTDRLCLRDLKRTPTSEMPVFSELSGHGWLGLLEMQGEVDIARDEFLFRWRESYADHLLPIFAGWGWETPRTVSFSGGILKLSEGLSDHMLSLNLGGASVFAASGKHAEMGLFGAALLARDQISVELRGECFGEPASAYIPDTMVGGGGSGVFKGFHGSVYNFVGTAGHSYALVSTPNVAVNSLFGRHGIKEVAVFAGTHRVVVNSRGKVKVNGKKVKYSMLSYDESYIGCMDMQTALRVVGRVSSANECQKACRDRGFALATISGKSAVCRCTDDRKSLRLLPKAWCARPCPVIGAPCGSKHGMSVYETSPRSVVLDVSVNKHTLKTALPWSPQEVEITRVVLVETGIFTLRLFVEPLGQGESRLHVGLMAVDDFRAQIMEGALGQTGQDVHYPSVYDSIRPVSCSERKDESCDQPYPLRGSDRSDYETKSLLDTSFAYDLFVW